MKSFYRIAMILFLCFLLIACRQEPIIKDIHGNLVNLNDHPDKWLVLNYWTAWCSPCLKEIPELNAFYQAEKGRIDVIGVEYDQLPITTLQAVVARMGIEYPVLREDPAKLLKLDEIAGLPTTFIFNPVGELKAVLTGPQTVQSLTKAIEDSDE